MAQPSQQQCRHCVRFGAVRSRRWIRRGLRRGTFDVVIVDEFHPTPPAFQLRALAAHLAPVPCCSASPHSRTIRRARHPPLVRGPHPRPNLRLAPPRRPPTLADRMAPQRPMPARRSPNPTPRRRPALPPDPARTREAKDHPNLHTMRALGFCVKRGARRLDGPQVSPMPACAPPP